AHLGDLRAARCRVLRHGHQRAALGSGEHFIGVGRVAVRLTFREPLTQPAKCVVHLPQGELVYAERVDQHLESNSFGLREQQGAPRLPWLGAGHTGIDDGSGALLEDGGDAQVPADLETARIRHCHQQLPRSQRPYRFINRLFVWHLIEEVDDSIHRHHLSQAVAAERHGSGAHQMEHCIDQARRDTEVLRIGHSALLAVAGTRAAKRTCRSPTATSSVRAAPTLGSVQWSGCASDVSSWRAVAAPLSVTHTWELPNSPRPRPRPGPAVRSTRGSLRSGPRNRRTRSECALLASSTTWSSASSRARAVVNACVVASGSGTVVL